MKNLAHELLLICEGSADRNFFLKFLESRPKIPKFEVPFPERQDELISGGLKKPFGGAPIFPEIIKAVRADAR